MDIFATNLTRKEILKATKTLSHKAYKNLRINIHRNHAFEPIQSVIEPFLDFALLHAEFILSNYDDSLSYENLQKSDLEIVFIDLESYAQDDIMHYILQRIQILRSLSQAPILVLLLDICDRKEKFLQDFNAMQKDFESLVDTQIFFISQLLCTMQEAQIIDETKFKITGTRLSNAACIALAQILGLSLIPALTLPSLKAIVLDLDNTLYHGILGEDGLQKIKFDEHYAALHQKILDFKKQGFFLALASKNEYDDVKELFETRKDFVLKLSDFDCIKVSWNPKRQSLQEIAKRFNIGLDSILFIDDNIAEIENVKDLGVKTILATSPKEVLRILELFPQTKKFRLSNEDILRSSDIQANLKRQELQELSQEDYFKQLQITLDFSIDNMENLIRTTELLNKTNQFISNYTRPTQEQVKEWMQRDDMCIITINMRDILSNSGIIAIFVMQEQGNDLCILDLCISCRALGRKLEKIMFFETCNIAHKRLQTNADIIVLYQKGSRNMPFIDFLHTLHAEFRDNQAIVHTESIDTTGLQINIRF